MGLAKGECFLPLSADSSSASSEMGGCEFGTYGVKWSGLERIPSKILTPSPP